MRKSLMRMTLRQLQIFNEVCDLRSYSRAAEEMALTQPAVSLQIRQLEELIGQPLFEYVGKKLYLTEAAEALQRASHDIFGRLESLDMQLSDMQGSLQGQLKLAIESSAGRHRHADFPVIQRSCMTAIFTIPRNYLHWDISMMATVVIGGIVR